MRRSKTMLETVSIALLGLLVAGAAFADDHEGPYDLSTYSERRRLEADAAERDASLFGVWEYDTYYIFPLTRHMADSGLPEAVQYALYPIAFALDLGQWPVGALCGLAGK